MFEITNERDVYKKNEDSKIEIEKLKIEKKI